MCVGWGAGEYVCEEKKTRRGGEQSHRGAVHGIIALVGDFGAGCAVLARLGAEGLDLRVPVAVAEQVVARRRRVRVHAQRVDDGRAREPQARVGARRVHARGVDGRDELVDVPVPAGRLDGVPRRAHVEVRARPALAVALAPLALRGLVAVRQLLDLRLRGRALAGRDGLEAEVGVEAADERARRAEDEQALRTASERGVMSECGDEQT